MIRLYTHKMTTMITRRFVATVILTMLALMGCSGANTFLAHLAGRPAPAMEGDPAHGEQVFRIGVEGAPPCSACHQVAAGSAGFSLAPNLAGIASRAAERIPGMTAAQYLEESILHPASHVIPGYHVSMFTGYAAYLSPQDLSDLIAYLMTLRG